MSLRLRLLVAAGTVALVALIAADLVTYSQLRSYLYNQDDQTLEAAHPLFEQALNNGLVLDAPEVARLAPGMFVEVRDPSGHLSGVAVPAFQGGGQLTPHLPAKIALGPPPAGRPGENQTYFTTDSTQPGGPPFRVRASALADGGLLILALPLTSTANTLHHLFLVEAAVTLAALAAAIGLGWWLVRVGLRPLEEVEQTAEAIADGHLDRRVPESSVRTEVGRLTLALNAMLGRIQDAFRERDATEAELRASEERLRRFIADASHELRTPLAAVGAYAELFDRGAGTRPADLGRVMTGIRSETSRMGMLVDDLLLLARLDEGRPLERQPVELVALAAEASEASMAVGPQWPVRLDASVPIEITADGNRLRQVLDNLLANVRTHTPAGTETVITIGDAANDAVIRVSDDGPGMTQEQAARVFERFYRPDDSRSREHGGAGLGLSIAAAIVGAHEGTISVSAPLGGGSIFTIRLPIRSDDGGTLSERALNPEHFSD